MAFVKASKKQARGRVALVGPSGSGKSFTALKMAQELGLKVAAIDSERGSLSKYADLFNFDVMELDTFAPKTYVNAIKAAEDAGYEVLIIDSLSHAWMGKDGALEMADKETTRSKSGSSFSAWRSVTPEHNDLVEAILQSKMHIIATMRVKTEYVLEKDDRGKTTPKKVGLAPVQRAGVEYEFDLIVDLDQDNNLIVSKSRCPELNGRVSKLGGTEEGKIFKRWLSEGIEVVPAPRPVEQPKATEAPAQVSGAVYQQLSDQFQAVTDADSLKAAKDAAALAHSERRVSDIGYGNLAAEYRAAKARVGA